MQKLRQRRLIADDVGLGKTIEAGLILKELAAQNRADRVLFVVPAHLQKKWVRDMDRFFGIDLTPGDSQWVEGERRRLGEEANIWNQDHQQMISSMAFLRQDEFQPALEDAFWDVVIINEAHKAAKRSDSPSKTSKMVERVAGNSDSLLLLSATPHDGKGEAFRSLVEYIDPFLVAEDQDLTKEAVDRVMIRRGKQTIYDEDGERLFPDRDVKTVGVEMSHEERQFYRAVTDYVKNVYNRSEQLNEPQSGSRWRSCRNASSAASVLSEPRSVGDSVCWSTRKPAAPNSPKRCELISKGKTSTNTTNSVPKTNSRASQSRKPTRNSKRKSRRFATSSRSHRAAPSTRKHSVSAGTSSSFCRRTRTRKSSFSPSTATRSTTCSTW